MRRFALVALGVAAIVAVVVWLSDDGAPAAPRAGDGELPRRIDDAGAIDTSPVERVDVAVGSGDPDADRVEFRVVDAETEAPIEGVRVYCLSTASTVGTTDADGRVAVVGFGLAALVFLSDQHLSPLNTTVDAETRRMEQELAAGDPVVVRLEPDLISRRCTLRFTREDGQPVAGATCTMRPLDAVSVPSPQRWRAFMQATLVVPPVELPVHFGPVNMAHQYRANQAGELEMRFVGGGRYRLVGTGSDGELFAADFDSGDPGPHVIRARADLAIRGVVVDRASGDPVSGASVEAGGIEVITLESGRFALGPIEQPSPIQASAFGYWDAELEATAPGSELRIELEPLPRWQVTIDVRVAGAGSVVRGAAVGVGSPGRVVPSTMTGADGRVALDVPNGEDAWLLVRADGFLPWHGRASEETLEVSLVPASPEARVASSVSGCIRGRVTGLDGAPRTGISVRAQPLSRVTRVEIPPPFAAPAFVLTDADGRYELECTAAGHYLVYAEDDESHGQTVSIVLGTYVDDIDLQTDF